MKKLFSLLLCAIFIICPVTSCSENEEADGIRIVATNFPSYDFTRQLTKDTDADVTMLLPPGGDSHSYDPTPRDIVSIGEADVFVYVGGVSDTWAEDVLASAGNPDLAVFPLTEHAELFYNEDHGDDHEHSDDCSHGEYDEHVWTSPKNVISICRELSALLCETDPENSERYRANLDSYVSQLEDLDAQFRFTVDHAAHKTVVFGDRFPLIYFADEYGLEYYSAFSGCSTAVEASAATVAELIDRVKENSLPAVFHIELSNTDICETIAEECGVEVLQFNACHNLSAEEFEGGATYISLMKENVRVLEIGLG